MQIEQIYKRDNGDKVKLSCSVRIGALSFDKPVWDFDVAVKSKHKRTWWHPSDAIENDYTWRRLNSSDRKVFKQEKLLKYVLASEVSALMDKLWQQLKPVFWNQPEPGQAISNLKLLSNIPIRSYELYWSIEKRINVTLERTVDAETGNIYWAIRNNSSSAFSCHCLNKSAKWERERFSSNLDETFCQRTRWDSPEEAYRFWINNDCEGRFIEM